jgi:hypothetical protein
MTHDRLAHLLRDIDGLLRETIEVSRAQVAHLDDVLGRMGRKVEPAEDLQDGEPQDDATRHARARHAHAAVT